MNTADPRSHSHISVGPDGESALTGQRSTHPRAKQLFNLILTLQGLLPSHVDIHVSDHDLGSWILGDDQRDLAMTRIQTAMREDLTGLNNVKFLTQPELTRLENRKRNGHPGWFVSRGGCEESPIHPDSPHPTVGLSGDIAGPRSRQGNG